MQKINPAVKSLDDIIETAQNGDIEKISPELASLISIRENDGFHDNDPVLLHVKRVVKKLILLLESQEKSGDYFNSLIGSCTRGDLMVVSAVFHDIAKGQVFKEKEGITSCPGHEKAGLQMIKKFFAERHPGDDELEYILALVEAHGVPHLFLEPENINIESDFDMLAEKYSSIYPDLLLFLKADVAGSQLESKNREHFDFINNYLDKRIASALS